MFYVYVLLDPRKPGKFSYRNSQNFDYEPYYIGKGKDNRINEHDGEIYSKARTRKANKIRKIFKETGQLPLKIKLFENLTEDQSFEIEIFLIKQIGRLDHQRGPLTNASDGGEGPSGWIMSQETKKKLSKFHKGRFFSVETKRKMSASLSGRHPTEETKKKMSKANSGKKHSEESKKKMSIIKIGHFHSKETREKISISLTGRHLSEEHKKKISISNENISEEVRRKISEKLSGENHPLFGKKHSEETRKKISISNKGKHHIEESKRKMSVSHSGKQHSEETKQKMREAALKRNSRKEIEK